MAARKYFIVTWFSADSGISKNERFELLSAALAKFIDLSWAEPASFPSLVTCEE